MKIKSIILLLLIGISVLGLDSAYRGGMEAMIAGGDGEHGCWSYYYGIGVLGRHGGKAGEQARLALQVQLMSKEGDGGLLDGMRDVVCTREVKALTRLQNVDGGWPVEAGGQSEVWGTLLAMECLLDLEMPPKECGIGWNWLVKRFMDDGGVALCRRGTYEQRVVCQLVKVGGMVRRHGWGLDAKSRKLLDDCVLWLEQQWWAEDFGNRGGVYDKALALKGLCLLGLHDDWEWLARWLVNLQSEDGQWHDGSIVDDWLTTCAVVDALGAFLVAVKEGEGMQIGWKDDEDVAMFGAREFAEIELGGLTDGNIVTLEIYRDDELVDFVYAGEVTGGCVSWFTGVQGAGGYELQVVVWDMDGSWLEEVVLDFMIKEDMICRKFKWDRPGHDKVLYLGEELETDLELSWEYDGNVDGVAELEWKLSKDGVEMDGGEVEVELSRKSRHCQCLLERKWNMRLELLGVYELTGRLVTMQGEYVCKRLITIVREKSYEVENDVRPRQIELGAARLRHTLKIRCIGEEMPVGHEAGFSVKPDDRRLVDENGEELEIELEEIYDSEGRRMMDGWLAVQSYYGHCEGDADLHTQRADGFLCVVKVMDGKARFSIRAEDKMKKGVIAVTVYQMDGLDASAIGEKLGVFDVHLVWR